MGIVFSTPGKKKKNYRMLAKLALTLKTNDIYSWFLSSGEKRLKQLTDSTKEPTGKHSWTVDDIIDTVTAKNLCSCRDPIKMAFKVHTNEPIHNDHLGPKLTGHGREMAAVERCSFVEVRLHILTKRSIHM